MRTPPRVCTAAYDAVPRNCAAWSIQSTPFAEFSDQVRAKNGRRSNRHCHLPFPAEIDRLGKTPVLAGLQSSRNRARLPSPFSMPLPKCAASMAKLLYKARAFLGLERVLTLSCEGLDQLRIKDSGSQRCIDLAAQVLVMSTDLGARELQSGDAALSCSRPRNSRCSWVSCMAAGCRRLSTGRPLPCGGRKWQFAGPLASLGADCPKLRPKTTQKSA